MKKRRYLGLARLPLLVSCSSDREVSQALGDGNVENDEIYLRYRRPSSLKSGDQLSFSLSREKDAKKENVSLGLSFRNPLLTDSYSEKTLFSVKYDDLAKTIGGKALSRTYTFSDLSGRFEKKEETSKFYFVFRLDSWTRRDVTSYSAREFKCTFEGEKRKIVED